MVYYVVSVLFLMFFWCPCMAINVNVQNNVVGFKFVLSRVLLMAYSSILLEYVLDSTYS